MPSAAKMRSLDEAAAVACDLYAEVGGRLIEEVRAGFALPERIADLSALDSFSTQLLISDEERLDALLGTLGRVAGKYGFHVSLWFSSGHLHHALAQIGAHSGSHTRQPATLRRLTDLEKELEQDLESGHGPYYLGDEEEMRMAGVRQNAMAACLAVIRVGICCRRFDEAGDAGD